MLRLVWVQIFQVKQNPRDRIEKLRFPVDPSWASNRKFLAVEFPLVPHVPTLTPVPGPEPNWLEGGGGGGGGGKRKHCEAGKVKPTRPLQAADEKSTL